MSNGIPPVAPGDTVTHIQPKPQRAGEAVTGAFSLPRDGAPSSPPAEVLAALDGAARVHRELDARGLSVSFDVQPEGDVRVSVVDGSGKVVHSLSPARALDLLGSLRGVQELG